MTSWIDGSFVYSTKEAWVSTMRTYSGNGALRMMGDPEDDTGAWMSPTPPNQGMPPYNSKRVPLFNHPSPHIMKNLNPERMFGTVDFIEILFMRDININS